MAPATSAAPASRVLLASSNSGNQLHQEGGQAASTIIKAAASSNASMPKSVSKENIPTSPTMPTSVSANKIRALAEVKTASSPAPLQPGRWQGANGPSATPGPIAKSASAGDLVGDESKGSWRSWKRGEGLQPHELEIANSSDIRRKANVSQLCEPSF